MLKHSLPGRSRAALIATTAAAAVLAAPVPAFAEPRATHAPIEFGDLDEVDVDSADTDDELLVACPVDGPATYEDSWGWPRSGGRSHQGVDMIADQGLPVIAVRDGDVEFKQNTLGGNAVWLTTDNGDRFYYAHLAGFEGQSRSVAAGELIGYVGSTGNAGGPHLHFETHPGGSVENPYGHTLAACVPSAEEIAEQERDDANALNDPAVWARFLPRS